MDPIVAQLILRDRKIAYAVTDRDLNVVDLSGALGTLHGGHDDNWLGHPLTALVPELIGNEESLADILTGESSRFELPWINRELPDGQTLYLTMIDLPYTDQSGRVVGVIHLVQDVTEMAVLSQRLTQRRNDLRLLREELDRHNLELAAANTELQRVGEMKSNFVSVAAHELRTPLTSIIGYLELLLDEEFGPLTERQAEYLEIVQGSATRLLAITNDLLDLTRIEAGRVELVLQPTDLAALIEKVAAEQAPQLEAKAQRLTLRASLGLPMALCDSTRAAQIITNLLSNASKYAQRGGSITIDISRAAEKGFLQVAVMDNGVGIAPGDQAKLFTRFFRAGNTYLTSAGGVGLGLSIARSLAELHGGRIWFESELNQGSIFYVTFPIADTAGATFSTKSPPIPSPSARYHNPLK